MLSKESVYVIYIFSNADINPKGEGEKYNHDNTYNQLVFAPLIID